MSQERKNDNQNPFYIPLLVNDLYSQNCMLDSGASKNVMSLTIMQQLCLTTTRPYRNVCSMDAIEIKLFGMIRNLHVLSVAYLDISIVMDIVVIDIPDSWAMFISRKWVVDLGGSLQMEISYATFPTPEGNLATFHTEQFQRYHIEYPNEPMNEFLCSLDDDMGNYIVLLPSLAPKIGE